MKKQISTLAIAGVVGLLAPTAQAATFLCIEGTASNCSRGTNEINVSLSNPTNTTAQFLFTNTSSTPSLAGVVANVYFDVGTTTLVSLTGITFQPSTGVNFASGGNPANLPGGNAINFSADASAEAASPKPTNGINPGESLGVTFNLTSNTTFSQLLTAFNTGTFRVGAHVLSVGQDEGSISLVTPIPEPQEWAMMLAGLGLVGVIASRRQRMLQAG